MDGEKNESLQSSSVPVNLSRALHENLQEMIGLHKQLLEVTRNENEAITQADVKATYEAAASKEALLHWIARAESSRQAIVYTLIKQENITAERPSLRDIILHFETRDAAIAQSLNTDLNALVILVERIKKQNELNGRLVESSMKHIDNMKKNIFGEIAPSGKTYNQHGQKNQAAGSQVGSRLISTEV